MSQDPLLVPSGSGLAVRVGFNAAIARLATKASGVGRPADIQVFEDWIETDNPGAGIVSWWLYDGSEDILIGTVDVVFHTIELNATGGGGGGTTVPAGVMVDYAGTAAPAGWLLCAGQSLVRTTYPALFAAIGTTYGSADIAHFNLPDRRGRVSFGKDNMGGAGANRLTTAGGGIDGDTLGATGGAESRDIAIANLPGGTIANIDTTVGSGGASAGFLSVVDGAAATFPTALASTGSGTDLQTPPPGIVLNVIIKA